MYDFQILKEDGGFLLNSADDSVILEKYNSSLTDAQSNNTDFESLGEGIIDFTAFNPFGEVQVRP
jgi:hypothetical protein